MGEINTLSNTVDDLTAENRQLRGELAATRARLEHCLESAQTDLEALGRRMGSWGRIEPARVSPFLPPAASLQFSPRGESAALPVEERARDPTETRSEALDVLGVPRRRQLRPRCGHLLHRRGLLL